MAVLMVVEKVVKTAALLVALTVEYLVADSGPSTACALVENKVGVTVGLKVVLLDRQKV